MIIKNKKTSEIKEAEYNPRKISNSEFEKLKKSIKEFGVVRPLIINKRTGNLISGHQTLAASRVLGLDQCPTIEIDVDEKREKTLNIALNKIQGEFDYDKLRDILEEIKEEEYFDCSGFEVADIDLMEKLNDDGTVLEAVPEEVKEKEYRFGFAFKDEEQYKQVKDYFKSSSEAANAKLLIKLITEKNEK